MSRVAAIRRPKKRRHAKGRPCRAAGAAVTTHSKSRHWAFRPREQGRRRRLRPRRLARSNEPAAPPQPGRGLGCLREGFQACMNRFLTLKYLIFGFRLIALALPICASDPGSFRGCCRQGCGGRTTGEQGKKPAGSPPRPRYVGRCKCCDRPQHRSAKALRSHLAAFVDAYNIARRLKTLKGLTPCEAICKAWTKEPERFTINPLHQMPGRLG